MLEALVAQFASLQDPRCEWRVEHKLVDILVVRRGQFVPSPGALGSRQSSAAIPGQEVSSVCI